MRQVYLVTYDIADDTRRNLVFKILRGFGDHLQFSVFRCELAPIERIRLRTRLQDAIHNDDDQVLFADLGPSEGRGLRAMTSLGRPYSPPDRRAIVF